MSIGEKSTSEPFSSVTDYLSEMIEENDLLDIGELKKNKSV